MSLFDYNALVLATWFIWNCLRMLWFVDSNSTECGGNVTGSYGFLNSINFPAPYPKNLDCYWTIISPPGTTLTVTLLYVALNGSCKEEFLEVTENRNGFRTCNRTLPEPFQTSGHVANVHFVSDNKTDPHYYIGFNLEWKVTDMYTLQKEQVTWQDAHEACALSAGELVNEYDVTKMASLVNNDDVTTVWQGKYLTQWVWLEGCYQLDGNEFGSPVILQANQMMKCLDNCPHTNYFGLQAEKCYCFDSFDGRRLSSGKNCTHLCPGNHKEPCGSNSTLTIYMNDICYSNSTQWSGTVARTSSGKPCIPWTNVTAEDHVFPDNSVHNASNYCRDPDTSSYLWCYVSTTRREQCDIPKCIAKEANSASSCMVYRSTRKSEVDLQFKQYPCNGKARTSCLSNRDSLSFDHKTVDWTVARNMCRGNRYAIRIMFKHSLNLAGPSVFRLFRYNRIKDFHWLGYFRTKATVSQLPPVQQPSECFILTKTNGTPHESVTDCHEKMPFICQHVPITCGEEWTGSRGEISSPGYPTGYGAYLHCQWNLVVATGYIIILSYEVNIKKSPSCRRDSVKIIDENNGDTLLLCGETMGTYKSTGNTATIRFLSDKTLHETKGFHGFHLTWTSEPGPLADELSDDNGGPNTGLILTLIVGLLCIVGIVLLVAAVVRYRKTIGIRQRLDSIACKFKQRRVSKADISVPGPVVELHDDNDIDHVSGASFEVSNDSNSQSDDGGSYLNITFRQGPSSKLNKSISMENIMYASPHQSIGDINESVIKTTIDNQTEDVTYEDTVATDTETENKTDIIGAADNKLEDFGAADNKSEDVDAVGDKVEDLDVELTHRADDVWSDGRVLYSYARESGFPKNSEIVDTEDMDNLYDTYEVNDQQEEYNSLSW